MIKRWSKNRHGVALLITLFFIIAITAAVGVSLMNLRKSGEELHQARFDEPGGQTRHRF
jgi:hypothetical protein